MRKKVFCTAIVISAALCAALIFSSCTKEVSATVDKNAASVEVSQDLYGLFLEDISFAGDGGLISELVNNKSFEYEYDHSAYWRFSDLQAYTDANEYAMNENNSNYLHVSVNGKGTALNLGYVEFYDDMTANYNEEKKNTPDMGFVQGETYDFSAYVYNMDFSGSMTAAPSYEGCSVSANIALPAQNGVWTKVTGSFTADKSEDGGLLLTFEGTGNLLLDFVSLTPRGAHGYGDAEWKYVTLRSDLYEALDRLNPSFIRFPGGCLAEGDDLQNLFSWKNTVGPLEERKHANNIWRDDENGRYYGNTFSLGYHEYFQLCEDLGALPLPILNVGMICQFQFDPGYRKTEANYRAGKLSEDEWNDYLSSFAYAPGSPEYEEYTQDILDLLDYALAPAGTNEWADLRAENGHPEPFDLRYLGLGNENWGDVYWRNFEPLYNAVKSYCAAKGYDVTVISSASYQFTGEHIDESWEIINEKYTDTLVDEHYYTSGNKLFKNNDRYDNYERTGATVFVGEYAATCWGIGKYLDSNNMYSAIEEASYMTAFERNGDLVKMASYAPTFAKYNAHCWDRNMIWFTSRDIVLTPNYFNQLLFSNNTGTRYIPTDLSFSKGYSSVTVDEESQTLYIKVVNASGNTINTSFSLQNFGDINASSMQYIAGVKAAYNEPGATTVAPVQKDCVTNGSVVSASLLPYSINVIRVCYGDNDGSALYSLPPLPDNMTGEVTEFTKPYITPEAAIAIGVTGAVILLAAAAAVVFAVLKKNKRAAHTGQERNDKNI